MTGVSSHHEAQLRQQQLALKLICGSIFFIPPIVIAVLWFGSALPKPVCVMIGCMLLISEWVGYRILKAALLRQMAAAEQAQAIPSAQGVQVPRTAEKMSEEL